MSYCYYKTLSHKKLKSRQKKSFHSISLNQYQSKGICAATLTGKKPPRASFNHESEREKSAEPSLSDVNWFSYDIQRERGREPPTWRVTRACQRPL